MRPGLIFITLPLWAVAAGAAVQPAAGPQMVRRVPGPIAPPAHRGTEARVPMAFDQGIPVVAVLVNGRPYRFAIDTGAAGHGRIRPAVAEALRLAPAGEMRAGDGSGRSQMRTSFAVDSLAVGGITFSGVRLSEMPALPGRLEGVDGILGLHLFAGHLLTLDYAGAQLVLGTGRLGEDALPYDSARGGIVIPVRIGQSTLHTTVDTGNAIAPLIVPASVAQALPTSGQPRRAGVARTGLSTVDIWEADLAVPVTIGNARAPIATVRYPALGENGNLGSLALRSAVVRIDQRGSRISIHFARPGRRR